MERTRPRRLFSLAKPWLAGVVALLWLVIAAEAAGHHHESGKLSHHPQCAACQMAHGTVLADGAVGVALDLSAAPIVFQSAWILPVFQSSDLRLSPGRAPPA